jgi:hypothetical protein
MQGLSRLATVAGFIGMVALIAFIGTVMNSKPHSLAQSAAKAASEKAHQAMKETLAVKILTSAVHSTPEQLRSVLRKWRDNQISNLDPFGGKQARISVDICDDLSSLTHAACLCRCSFRRSPLLRCWTILATRSVPPRTRSSVSSLASPPSSRRILPT